MKQAPLKDMIHTHPSGVPVLLSSMFGSNLSELTEEACLAISSPFCVQFVDAGARSEAAMSQAGLSLEI